MKKFSPLIISYLIFGIAIAVILCKSIGNTGGNFIYTLDDPYIHMAIAKNFVTNGVWGITKNEFTSCSSSPLWTFIVSVSYFIFGVKDIIPFILNIIFASLTTVLIFSFVKNFTQNKIILTIILFFILFFTPFISVIFTGLEHSLYSFLIVATNIYFYKILKGTDNNKDKIIFIVSIMLLTATRYEGMFVVFAMFIVFLFTKKFKFGLLVLFISFLPILLIGFISVSKGWYFFPSSVLLKSKINFTDSTSFLRSIFNPQFFELLWAYKRILVLLLISVVMFFALDKDEDTKVFKILILVFIAVTLLHINFAKMGSLLRYEMYIMVNGIFLNSVLILKFIRNRNNEIKFSITFLLFVIAIAFSISTIKAAADVPISSTNIFQMQYQMSKFINKFYDKKVIALNDIGVVNYYNDINCVDLWGLGNKVITEQRKKNTYNTERIFEINIANKTDIAVVFDSWFEQYGRLPKQWYKAGIWIIPNNITCGSDSITFYAMDSSGYSKLVENLKLFSQELPTQVKQVSF